MVSVPLGRAPKVVGRGGKVESDAMMCVDTGDAAGNRLYSLYRSLDDLTQDTSKARAWLVGICLFMVISTEHISKPAEFCNVECCVAVVVVVNDRSKTAVAT